MEYTTIEEFPNYEINELGQIRNKQSKKILSQNLSTKGYYQVNIADKCRRVHRLLALTFIPNPDELETVNHIDGDKLNNDLSNLEWLSRADNIKHAREELGIKPIPYSKCDREHHLVGKNGSQSTRGKQISAGLEDGTIKVYGSAYEAALELFGDREKGKQIRQSINRGSNSYKGIKFRNYEKSTNTT